LKIGLLINTPAQVHFWKFIVQELRKKNHEILILFRDRGETLELAKEVGLQGQVYSVARGRGISKSLSFPFDVINAVILLRNFKPDLILDFGIYGVAVAQFLGARSLVFTDSEPSIKKIYSVQYRLFMPFVSGVITPSFFHDDLGIKQIKVNSLKELAYLHPNYFAPNDNIYELLKITREERFVIIRFNDLAGVHDIGLNSFSISEKRKLINVLEKARIRTFISFEGIIPPEFKKYQLSIPKSRVHDALYFADLLVTDTQTMTTEAAILGTPVIRCNTFVGKNDMGNFIELENKYNLVYNFYNPDDAINKTIELLSQKHLKHIWKKKAMILIKEKIDIVYFMLNHILSYNK
jgi:predicted glycosyltransferase